MSSKPSSVPSQRERFSARRGHLKLLQTLRTKVFLSVSDDSSAELASNMCGKVLRLYPSYSFTESAKPGFSVITARAGGAKGTLGTSKSYREQREPLFHPRAFSLLENCQAIILLRRGRTHSPPPASTSSPTTSPATALLARAGGRPVVSIRIIHLKRFLPGRDDPLADTPVTELMVGGPETQEWKAPGAGLEHLPAPNLSAGSSAARPRMSTTDPEYVLDSCPYGFLTWHLDRMRWATCS